MIYASHEAMAAANPVRLSASAVRLYLDCNARWFAEKVARTYLELEAGDSLKRGALFDAILTQPAMVARVEEQYHAEKKNGEPYAWAASARRAAAALQRAPLWQTITADPDLLYQVVATTTINGVVVAGIIDVMRGTGPLELKCPDTLDRKWDKAARGYREWHENPAWRAQVALQWQLCRDNGLPCFDAGLLAVSGENPPALDAKAFDATTCAMLVAYVGETLAEMDTARTAPPDTLRRCEECDYCRGTAPERLTAFTYVD